MRQLCRLLAVLGRYLLRGMVIYGTAVIGAEGHARMADPANPPRPQDRDPGRPENGALPAEHPDRRIPDPPLTQQEQQLWYQLMYGIDRS
jgi:hypothetical protein